MNVANIQAAISIMERAGKVNMRFYQTPKERLGPLKTTEEELHACGNSACFAGWVAVSPEWKAYGGSIGLGTEPCIQHAVPPIVKVKGAAAIAKWLDIPIGHAESLVHGDTVDEEIDWQVISYSTYYNKDWLEVTAEDVVAKLKGLLHDNEL